MTVLIDEGFHAIVPISDCVLEASNNMAYQNYFIDERGAGDTLVRYGTHSERMRCTLAP